MNLLFFLQNLAELNCVLERAFGKWAKTFLMSKL